jgi:hypothetical protein
MSEIANKVMVFKVDKEMKNILVWNMKQRIYVSIFYPVLLILTYWILIYHNFFNVVSNSDYSVHAMIIRLAPFIVWLLIVIPSCLSVKKYCRVCEYLLTQKGWDGITKYTIRLVEKPLE